MDIAIRSGLIAGGLMGAGHYFLMANFITHAPRLIKWGVFPIIVSAMVAMIWGGFTGQTAVGELAAIVGVLGIALLDLTAWAKGVNVSATFARSADRDLERVRALTRRAEECAQNLKWQHVHNIDHPLKARHE